jgi:hypothetical protein
MLEEVSKYLAKIGRRGGKIGGLSTSRAKVKAARTNIELAHDAKRKYPPCPNYNNKSHRFSKATGICYGCGYRKPKAS